MSEPTTTTTPPPITFSASWPIGTAVFLRNEPDAATEQRIVGVVEGYEFTEGEGGVVQEAALVRVLSTLELVPIPSRNLDTPKS